MLRWLWVLVAVACRTQSATPTPSPSPSPSPANPTAVTLDAAAPVTHIAVGSCLDQRLPMPIVSAIEASAPQLLIMLGDNVYADATSAKDLDAAYQLLATNERWRSLHAAVPMLVTWDDHDFGLNDSGKDNPVKGEAKRAMLGFFGEPADSARRQRDGVYDAVTLGPQGQRAQVILLDTRWFRDPLVRGVGGRKYVPHPEPGPTLLGPEQWKWLEAALREPAEVRVLVSSIQVIVDDHGYESWALFPAERARLMALLARTPGVVIVSGDRHRGEISCAVHPDVGYPLLELTSSSLNRPIPADPPNRLRVAGTPLITDPNFGEVRITWNGAKTRLELALNDVAGRRLVTQELALGALKRGLGDVACADFDE